MWQDNLQLMGGKGEIQKIKVTLTEIIAMWLVSGTCPSLKTLDIRNKHNFWHFMGWWFSTEPFSKWFKWLQIQSTFHHLLQDWMWSTFTQKSVNLSLLYSWEMYDIFTCKSHFSLKFQTDFVLFTFFFWFGFSTLSLR